MLFNQAMRVKEGREEEKRRERERKKERTRRKSASLFVPLSGAPVSFSLAHSLFWHVHAWTHHGVSLWPFVRSFGFRACLPVLFVFCPKNRSHNGPGQPMVCVNHNTTATNRSAVEGLSSRRSELIHTSRPSLSFSRSLC